MESKILNDFCFHKPKTLDEALVLIDKYQENGLLMEGGSEVIPNMKSLVVTPEHGLHPREQLHYLKRLDKIVVRAQAQALHLVGHGALRCEKNHGNAQRLYEIQQLVAADLRQHDVQQHEVEALLLQQVRRLQPVVGADAGIPRLREVHLDKIVDGPLVLHDKYPVHAVHLRPIQYNTIASNLHHTRLFQEKSRKNLLQIFRARFGMFCG